MQVAKQGTQTLPHSKGLLQKNAPHLTRENEKRARAQADSLSTPARFELGPRHDLVMVGQCLEPSLEQTRCHPGEEGYEQAGTVFGHAQEQEQGIQLSAESQGQQHNIGPSAGEKMDEEQGHQPRQTRIKRSHFDIRPICTAYPVARFHLLGGDYAFEASTGGKSDPASQYTPRTLNTEMPRGPHTAEGCAKIAEFLVHVPWEEQREGLIAT